MKKLLLSGFLLFSVVGMAIEEIPTPTVVLIDGLEMPADWTEYKTVDGVKIEYKMKQCESQTMRAQNLLLFKFTNTTGEELNVSWVTKIFRNDQCANCERLDDDEYAHEITLAPNEVLEGDGTTKADKSVYIFGNFITLVPGMSEQSLTNFEFVDLTVR